MSLSSKKQKRLLYSIIFLNFFSCFCSCLTESSIGKMKISVWQFCLDFFITTWCVWNSVLTIIYCLREINYHNKQNPWTDRFAFHSVVAVSNLITGVTFTYTSLTNTAFRIDNRPWWWYVYIVIWHYIAPALILFYFFKLVEIKKQAIKWVKLLLTISCLPLIYLGTNLVRSYSIDPIYFIKPFKKFMYPYLNWWEERKYWKLSVLLLLQILSFCLIVFLFIKLKERFFSQTVKNGDNHYKLKENYENNHH